MYTYYFIILYYMSFPVLRERIPPIVYKWRYKIYIFLRNKVVWFRNVLSFVYFFQHIPVSPSIVVIEIIGSLYTK